MKKVKAVQPYIYKGLVNFKNKPYNAWKKLGLLVAEPHYPPKCLHGLVFKVGFPSTDKFKSQKEARLRFMQPYSINFDAFPDYLFYEVIPFFWDVWPSYYDKVAKWLKRYRVKTAIFTASETADYMRNIFPEMNILWCPEGIDVENYAAGKELKDRTVDLLEFGRDVKTALKGDVPANWKYLHSEPGHRLFPKQEDFDNALLDTKIVVAYPRCDLQPELTGGLETLTQRYWEAMLTREVMVGRAPKELVELIGYNPVVELKDGNDILTIKDILDNLSDYQNMVDRNRETALRMAPWEIRMKQVMEWLESLGYKLN